MAGPHKMTPEEKAERNAKAALRQKEHFEEGQKLNYKGASPDIWGSEIRNYAVVLRSDSDPVLEAKREGLRAESEKIDAQNSRRQKNKPLVETVSSVLIGGSFLTAVASHWAAWPLLAAAVVGTAVKYGYDELQAGRRFSRQGEVSTEIEKLDERLVYADQAHTQVRSRLRNLKTQFALPSEAKAETQTTAAPSVQKNSGLTRTQKNRQSHLRRQGPAFN